jgi:hypothetical protein
MIPKRIAIDVDSEAMNEIIRESLIETCIDEAESLLGDDDLYCYLMTLSHYSTTDVVKRALKEINDRIMSEEFKNDFEDIKYWKDHVASLQVVTNRFLIEYYGSIE